MAEIKNKIHLEEHTLEVIKDRLQIELLKRGFLAPLTTVSVKEGNYPCIIVRSEDFQTTPVIFKQINIMNFGGSIKPEIKTRKKHGGEEYEEEIYRIWIPINVGYEHFDGGTNGSELFTLSGWVSNEQFSDKIYELRIS